MKEIKLSQHGKNRGKYTTLVDDDVYEHLNQWLWCVTISHGICYATRNIKTPKGRRHLRMHDYIMGRKDGDEFDHANRNGLDNQRHNLRKATSSQNKTNRKATGQIKYLGVNLHKTGVYRARICKDGKVQHLGCFDNPISAAKAYDAAAKKLHKEFANLNFK